MTNTQNWSRGKIRFELENAGVASLYDLDRKHGLPLGTCTACIASPHNRAEQVIADTIGTHPSNIWPTRYDADGHRLRPQPKTKYR